MHEEFFHVKLKAETKQKQADTLHTRLTRE